MANAPGAPTSPSDFYARVRALSDEEFIARVVRSAEQRIIDGVMYPGLPSKEWQELYVGASGANALAEAGAFYHQVKVSMMRLGSRLNPYSRVLDFGVGWGRIIRFFAHDVLPEHLLGVDVEPGVLDQAARCGLGVGLRHIASSPPLAERDGTFDLIYAFSVFSHLSAPSMGRWVREFARVLTRGGVAIVTTRRRSFIEESLALPETDRETYVGKLARAFDEQSLRDYDAGRVVHAHLGGDDPDYGETAVPLAYAQRTWSDWLQVVEYVDDLMPGRNVSCIVMQKPI